ncbi:hypothetical protein HDU76_003027 [Blyttiomyces sp. JEL0837]|nr:hypothetical protein HDU76_003027 [Blyttiomyces sp. JEL0837]
MFTSDTIRDFQLAYSLWNIVSIAGFLYVLYIRQRSVHFISAPLRAFLIVNMVGVIALKTSRYLMYYLRYFYRDLYPDVDFVTIQLKIDYSQEAWLAFIILTFKLLYITQIRKSEFLMEIYKSDPLGRLCILIIEVLLTLAVITSAFSYAANPTTPPFVDLKMILIGLISADTLDLRHDALKWQKTQESASGNEDKGMSNGSRKKTLGKLTIQSYFERAVRETRC